MSLVTRSIVFVSTLNGAPWGGSEELWCATAQRLSEQGHKVAASVCRWPQPVAQLTSLRKAGVTVSERWMATSKLRSWSLRKLVRLILDPLLCRVYPRVFKRWLAGRKPDLVCISKGWIGEDHGFMELWLAAKADYAVIVQAAGEQMWPTDGEAAKLMEFFQKARRVFFVSERNRTLLETQLGIQFANAEVVRNPFNVQLSAAPPWPAESEPVQLACVARLDPQAKGQDLLLHLLAAEPWRSRPVTVSFYGKGRSEQGLRRLVQRLGLAAKVRFCGHTGEVAEIWANHHALVLPSRFEGLPLVAVEAMLCGRPVIVTDVGGNTEIVEQGITGFIAQAATLQHLHLAMEQAWAQRQSWEVMGKAASRRIRQIMPADPARDFADKLLGLAGSREDL